MSRPNASKSPEAIQLEKNGLETPWRIAYYQPTLTAKVERPKERLVMTFPHLIVREIIAFEILSIIVVLISLFVDAPLEELANPSKTPNPAKAPWYFLGLQELLHFYPPIVAGVLLPGLVVIALIIVPYVRININQVPLSRVDPRRVRFGTFLLVAAASFFWLIDQHLAETIPFLRPAKFLFPEAVALDLFIPTVLVFLIPFALTFSRGRTRWTAFLRSRGLPFWIMTWFTTLAVVLTVVGTFFRGPGWTLVMPWK